MDLEFMPITQVILNPIKPDLCCPNGRRITGSWWLQITRMILGPPKEQKF